jgi:hypothetical protein
MSELPCNSESFQESDLIGKADVVGFHRIDGGKEDAAMKVRALIESGMTPKACSKAKSASNYLMTAIG